MRSVGIKDLGLRFRALSPRSATERIVIHHTGNPADDDCSAEEIHRSHLNQGWAGIGYHYVVRKDGTIEVGRPHWTVGAHAYGYNSSSVGIHFSGNFDRNAPTFQQMENGALLLAKLGLDYGLPLTPQYVVGHRDLIGTACPGGNLYARLQDMRGKGIWYQGN